MQVDIDVAEANKGLKKDVERHNKIFLFKFKDRIEKIQEYYKCRGIKKYKLPIIKDEYGKLKWINRKLRRANKVR